MHDRARRAVMETRLAPSLRRARRAWWELTGRPALQAAGEPADSHAGTDSEVGEDRDRRDNEHLRLLFAFALAADTNCIDVGANVGDTLALITWAAPQGSHIAYEPLPALYRSLVERFPNVDVRNAALSTRDGESTFQHVLEMPGYSGLRRRTYPKEVTVETITVRTERLDDHLPDGYAPGLIKIDVEGAEEQVIEGALHTISRHRPIVVFEHGRGAAEHYGTTPGRVFDLLCRQAKLRIFDIDGQGPLSLDRFEDSFARTDLWNYVAHR